MQKEAACSAQFTTQDGRLLAVEDRGDPAGWPVLVHHGTPSSRHSAFYGPYVRDAEADEPLREARALFASIGYKPALAETEALLGESETAAV